MTNNVHDVSARIHDSVGRLERSLEEGHQSFVDIRSQLEEVEKKVGVVNLWSLVSGGHTSIPL